MQVDHVTESELNEKEWEDVDDIRGEIKCHSCGTMRDCRMKGTNKGKNKDGNKWKTTSKRENDERQREEKIRQAQLSQYRTRPPLLRPKVKDMR